MTITPTSLTSQVGLDTVAELAAQLRVDSIRSSTSAGSGHPTSSMSAADLLAVLVTRHLHYDWDDPRSPANDHLIFSKGHASPLLYAVFKAVGVVSEDELLSGYRRFGQRLQGHPTPVLPWVDVATGSLGQGLPDGVGIALAGKYLERRSYRVWVLCGDSEVAEGSIWEALDKAAYYQLSNLIAMVDVNRLGQRGATELGWDMDAYARRAEAFGARVLVVDGHDLPAIDAALAAAAHTTGGQPTVILARTVKGRGFSEVEDSPDWHGRPLPADMADRAIAELGGVRNLVVRGPRPTPGPPTNGNGAPAPGGMTLPRYAVGDKVATRKAYGDALVALGAQRASSVRDRTNGCCGIVWRASTRQIQRRARYFVSPANSYSHSWKARTRSEVAVSDRSATSRDSLGTQVTVKPTFSNVAHARYVCMGDVTTATEAW